MTDDMTPVLFVEYWTISTKEKRRRDARNVGDEDDRKVAQEHFVCSVENRKICHARRDAMLRSTEFYDM